MISFPYPHALSPFPLSSLPTDRQRETRNTCRNPHHLPLLIASLLLREIDAITSSSDLLRSHQYCCVSVSQARGGIEIRDVRPTCSRLFSSHRQSDAAYIDDARHARISSRRCRPQAHQDKWNDFSLLISLLERIIFLPKQISKTDRHAVSGSSDLLCFSHTFSLLAILLLLPLLCSALFSISSLPRDLHE